MEDSSRLSFAVDPARTPHAPMLQVRDDWKVPAAVQRDLRVARVTTSNLLLVGSERQVLKLVSSLVPDVKHTVTIWCQEGQLLLPPPSLRVRTIVLHDVDALTREEQFRLSLWLDAASSATQIISTASAPLLSLVESRAFDPWLYYRLNTIYIDLSA